MEGPASPRGWGGCAAGWRPAGVQNPAQDPVPTGTRNAVLNTEARTIDADVLSRRCVLVRLLDFSYERYQRALRQSAGAVVIILPRTMAAVPQDVIRVSPASPRSPLSLRAPVPHTHRKPNACLSRSNSWRLSLRCWPWRPSFPCTLP